MVITPGWYILAFHEVSWEESPYLSGINVTFAPDVFAGYVRDLAARASLIGIEEGFEKWRTGALDRAYVSFWFDDAYAGVRRYALPVLNRHRVTAAISVNSRFTGRTEMFWRAKLSYLSHRDGLRFVRARLRKRGFRSGQSLRHASLDLFTMELVADIDEVYRRLTREIDRDDAFRLFDTWDGVRALRDRGWAVCNHTAAHYPVVEAGGLALLGDQFRECEAELEARLGQRSRFWVAPFDREKGRASDLQTAFDAEAEGRAFVLVGNRVNRAWTPGAPVWRITPPPDPSRLWEVLRGAARRERDADP